MIKEHLNNFISFQRVILEDIQILLDIEKTAAGLKTYSIYTTEKEITDYINNNVVYFIKNNDKIVGSISYKIKDKNHIYQSGLILKPEFQKQGLAKYAMAKLLEEVKDYRIINLVVHPDNISAIKLYESFGFIIKNRKENYYNDDEPRLVMVLEK